jgi:Uma2 family endonuclease
MCEVVLDEGVTIPEWVTNHAAFRRWARSDEFPERGRFSFLRGRVWVDMEMERDSHNQLKAEITEVLRGYAKARTLGRFWFDGMLLTHRRAGLSTEPDGMFARWETLRSRTARLVGGNPPDGVEVVGTPDMVLEVVSRKSLRKDTIELPELYWQAGIAEYWLVNPLGDSVRFDLLRHTPKGYRAVRPSGGWRKSAVFGASFRLAQTTDPLGHPAFNLEVR